MSSPLAPSAFDPIEDHDLGGLGAPPPPPKKGWSTWSPLAKVMVVLAIICGSLMVLFFLAAGLFGVWLYLPGAQVLSAYAVPGEAHAVLQLQADVDDEGVAAMLTLVGRQLEAQQKAEDREKLPPNLRFLADFQGGQTRSVLETVWPRDVVVALLPGDGLTFTAIVNPRRLGGVTRLASMVWASEDVQTEVHREHTLASSDGLTWTLSGSSVLLASSGELARAMVDRVADERTEAAAPPLTALAARLQEGSDAYAVAGFFPVPLPGVAPEAVARAGVAADLISDDEATGQLVVVAVPGQEAAVRAALEAYLAQLIGDARNDGYAVTAPLTEADGELRARWRITGLRAAVVRAIEEMGTDDVDPSLDAAFEPPADPGMEGSVDEAIDDAVEEAIGGALEGTPGQQGTEPAGEDEAEGSPEPSDPR